VTIRIVDHGIGMTAELLPRVFDLFVQANQGRAHSRYGMGIGLNLVKRIVELHQGAVDACSTDQGWGAHSPFVCREEYELTLHSP
jgi:signal transduction histidine kinase